MAEMLGSIHPRRLRRTAERYLALAGAFALGLTLMMASSASAAGQEPIDEPVDEIVTAELLAADAGSDATEELPHTTASDGDGAAAVSTSETDALDTDSAETDVSETDATETDALTDVAEVPLPEMEPAVQPLMASIAVGELSAHIGGGTCTWPEVFVEVTNSETEDHEVTIRIDGEVFTTQTVGAAFDVDGEVYPTLASFDLPTFEVGVPTTVTVSAAGVGEVSAATITRPDPASAACEEPDVNVTAVASCRAVTFTNASDHDVEIMYGEPGGPTSGEVDGIVAVTAGASETVSVTRPELRWRVYIGDVIIGDDEVIAVPQSCTPTGPTDPTDPAGPDAALSAPTVPATGTLTVSGSGFGPGEALELWLHSTPQLLGSAVAVTDGSFSTTVTIPAGTPAGQHRLEVRGAGSGSVWIPITVTAAPGGTGTGSAVSSGAADGSKLAKTGVTDHMLTFAAGAGALLLLGAGLMGAARRHSA